VQKRIIHTFSFLILATVLINYSCTKFDTTTIGSDLIPAVDNITTFGDTLSVSTFQGIFNNDSTRNNLFDQQALGAISNDPLFGKTNANIYLQLKPTFYPYYFGSPNDTLNGFGAQLDSVVLCIAYKGFWGDSTNASSIRLDVKEVNDASFKDSSYKVSFAPSTNSTILGTKTIDVRKFKDTIFYNGKNGFALNQIRIKLDLSNTFLNNLYPNTLRASDSSSGLQYYSDLDFRTKNKGLAIIASALGNGGLMSASLIDANTKLEVHFKRRNLGRLDSVYNSFVATQLSNDTLLNTLGRKRSASANNIVRDRFGAPVSNPSINEVFIQTTPGTYADLRIPAISNLPNCVVHRAELVMEQIPYLANPAFDTYFSAPNYLYIDLKDTTATDKWKPLYYDLNPGYNYNPDFAYSANTSAFAFPNQVDLNYHGGFKRSKLDKFGNTVAYYNFNITRHVQQIVTKHTPNYALRLSAPIELFYPQLFPFPISYYNTNIAYGRVRLGSGANPSYKMYVRIVYSKI
jgi:hypothetical protein